MEVDAIEANRALGAQATTQIEKLQDFHVLTGHSYGRYKEMVEAGHVTGSVTNVRTNSSMKVDEVASLLMTYLDDELPSVVIYQIISSFEWFFFEFLAQLLRHNPHASAQDRHVTVKEVIDAPDKGALLERIIDMELQKLRFKRVEEWFEYLSRVINLPDLQAEDIGRLAELKATRDILAHNAGVANEIYLTKAGDNARAEAGNPLPITRPYLYDSADFVKRLISTLSEAAAARLLPD